MGGVNLKAVYCFRMIVIIPRQEMDPGERHSARA